MLNDQNQRQLATDPTHSYIVQAPAGSGKTEILTQRFLRLLSRVTAPEQIIALTFTRKAAHEMRERILGALQKAAQHQVAASDNQQLTLSYAADALKQDALLQWNLLQNPARLRIITIDSLCQTITQAMPIQERQIPYATLSALPQRHYQTAARACFQHALEQPDLQTPLTLLLEHVDNRQAQLIAFFVDLLSVRDEWLHLIFQAKEANPSSHEEALALIINHDLARFLQTMPKHLATELMTLASTMAHIENNQASPRYSLQNWRTQASFNGTLAKSLAALLLTSQNTLRKSFDHHVGLKRGVCEDSMYTELKTKSQTLLAALALCPDFLDALNRIKKLPNPTYCPNQWRVLQALFSLLPLLAAHLHLVFSEHNEVDFTAVSAQALAALGDDENPTDLFLYFDHAIHHLLVDEFQDTSLLQWQLLTRLVQGFQPGDGKTLFMVGDPMQSIYRFRQAEVGLFLKAKLHGMGPVRLIPLELTSNFRSNAEVVGFINQHFKSIFPVIDDIESGAISFHPSQSIQQSDNTSCIKAFQCASSLDEAKALAHLLSKELQAHPDETFAILVRSRNQLPDILTALKEKNVPFQGVDIDRLSHLPHLRDVWTLTQLLLMPSNRLVWLSFLRSPWCGLSLQGLHAIANHAPKKSIAHALAAGEHIANLSDEDRLRARFIHVVLNNALTHREHQSLITCLIETLEHLHIKDILTESQQEDLEHYWQLLQQFLQEDNLLDLNQFELEFNKLYSKRVVPARCQIMTIHKSKGLEFDAVFLPGLGSKPPPMDTPMMRWMKIPRDEQGELVLISPIKAAFEESSPLYDYIGQIDAQKNSYELQRLLYVAMTRAKKRLCLFDGHEQIRKGSFRHLLRQVDFSAPESLANSTLPVNSLPPLMHLPIQFYEHSPRFSSSSTKGAHGVFTSNAPRLIGIVAHDLLHWICEHHLVDVAEIPWHLALHQLKTVGFDQHELEDARLQLTSQLTAFFHHPIGHWIKQPHVDERNEYELLVFQNQTHTTKIIDRTFCEHGIRWVIDFKTGHDDLNSQIAHQKQLKAYAEILHHRFAEESIRCGLFYLANQHWMSFSYHPKIWTLTSAGVEKN